MAVVFAFSASPSQKHLYLDLLDAENNNNLLQRRIFSFAAMIIEINYETSQIHFFCASIIDQNIEAENTIYTSFAEFAGAILSLIP